jgi:hypothetical protein
MNLVCLIMRNFFWEPFCVFSHRECLKLIEKRLILIINVPCCALCPTLIKKKTKFSSYIRKSRRERLQSIYD